MVSPTKLDNEHITSLSITTPQKKLILMHKTEYSFEAFKKQTLSKQEVYKLNHGHCQSTAANLKTRQYPAYRYALDLAQEKGASN